MTKFEYPDYEKAYHKILANPKQNKIWQKMINPKTLNKYFSLLAKFVDVELHNEPYVLVSGTNNYTDATAHYQNRQIPEVDFQLPVALFGDPWNKYHWNKYDILTTTIQQMVLEQDNVYVVPMVDLVWPLYQTTTAVYFDINTNYHPIKYEPGDILLRHKNYKHLTTKLHGLNKFTNPDFNIKIDDNNNISIHGHSHDQTEYF